MQRDLRDHLRHTFGPLAQVEITTDHPVLGQILEGGLQAGLDGWESLSGRSTHFVLIDFAQGQYELQARGHDGFTSIAGAGVKQARIGDRRLVGQKAAELVASNFSLAGTIVSGGKEIELTIRGAKLSPKMDRWLQSGDLFTVTRLRQEGDRFVSSPIPWAVLQVKDAARDGRCVGQWFHRYAADTVADEPGVTYRAVQLHTDRGPLQLQLIDSDTQRPLDGVPLQVFRTGFSPGEKPVELTTNRDGLAVTREPYTGVAFVRVLTRDTHQPRAQFPVEILTGRTAVARLKLGAESEGLASLNLRRDLLVRRVYDQLRVAADRVADLNVQLAAKSLDDALKTAQAGKASLDREIADFILEQDELVRQARLKKMAVDIAEAKEQIEELRRRGVELEKFAAQLSAVIKEANSPEALARKQLLQRARLLESQVDIEGALKLYGQYLEADPKQTEVRGHLEKLSAAWKPRDEVHEQARKFIYQIWPKVEVRELKAQLEVAEKAFRVCKEAGDPFAARKLLQAHVVHSGKLKARLDVLKRNDTPDNRAELKTIAEVAASLSRLRDEATALLRSKKEG